LVVIKQSDEWGTEGPRRCEETAELSHAGPVLATVKPGLLSRGGPSNRAETQSGTEEDGAFHLANNASPGKRKLAAILQKKLYFPDILLMLLFKARTAFSHLTC